MRLSDDQNRSCTLLQSICRRKDSLTHTIRPVFELDWLHSLAAVCSIGSCGTRWARFEAVAISYRHVIVILDRQFEIDFGIDMRCHDVSAKFVCRRARLGRPFITLGRFPYRTHQDILQGTAGIPCPPYGDSTRYWNLAHVVNGDGFVKFKMLQVSDGASRTIGGAIVVGESITEHTASFIAAWY